MRRSIAGWTVILLAIAVSMLTVGPAWALTFPVDETFAASKTDNPNWVLKGNAKLTNESTGWLQLTTKDTNQIGSAVLNDAFPSSQGIIVTFEYAAWGGTALSSKRGDGFSFFLIDGSKQPSVGPAGAALGYACRTTSGGGGSCGSAGVSGAYVGVGLDSFGGFSTGDVGNNTGTSNSPGSIVVRGSGDGTTGYNYLKGASGPGSTVETGSRANARTAQLTLQPDSNGQTFLSVESNSGPNTAMQKIITNLNLTAPSGQAALPATLKLGFAGSTGGATNFHEIRNLHVAVPTDLAVTKAGSSTAPLGGQISYALSARNIGANDANGVAVTDTVPSQITNVTWSCTGPAGPCGSGTTNTISITLALPKNTNATITVSGTVASATPSPVLNSATITAPPDRLDIDQSNNTTTVSTTVTTAADVTVRKTVAPGFEPVSPGTRFTYSLTTTNDGPATATAITVTDTLPGPLRLAATDAGCTSSGQTLTCAVAALSTGQSRAWLITVDLPPTYTGSGSDLANTAKVTSANDPNATNNSSTYTVKTGPPRADLCLKKTARHRGGIPTSGR